MFLFGQAGQAIRKLGARPAMGPGRGLSRGLACGLACGLVRGLVLGSVALTSLMAPAASTAKSSSPTETPASAAALPTVALATLPEQAQTTHRLILSGGPFRYEKDGVVFGNRERLLPNKKRGYYREYTVPTPGSKDRGARRIVCGGAQPAEPDACFYTADHYASFRLIVR